MAIYDMHPYKALEALRKELDLNRDLKERLTQEAPLLQTLGEICALMGIPVDLTLNEEDLINFMWTVVELLHKRRSNVLDIAASQKTVDAEVAEELATGIIVTDEKIVPASVDLITGTEVAEESSESVNEEKQPPTLH